ncbi:hypothetical protein [Flavitalea sp.]|nr:hypothetical protein [Flavitalea sp.]
MLRRLILILIIIIPARVIAQEVNVNELAAMVNMDHIGIDTLMKKKGYRLMQKDVDSVSEEYYYSHLERNEQSPTWVRALSYVDVNLKDIKSRVLTYRTYNRDEYQKMMSALLGKGYKTKNVFEFKDSKHTVFDNGKQPVRVKVNNNKMENGRWIKSYEFELGR